MKRLNKKGFTLVELLAVIVVLAVIMVIATQAIGDTLNKSRADSYASAVKSVGKAAETACTMDSKLDTIADYLQYEDITIDVAAGDEKVVVKPADGGKFTPMKEARLTNAFSTKYAVSGTQVTFTASCTAKNKIDLD